jgi:hypothetical protein
VGGRYHCLHQTPKGVGEGQIRVTPDFSSHLQVLSQVSKAVPRFWMLSPGCQVAISPHSSTAVHHVAVRITLSKLSSASLSLAPLISPSTHTTHTNVRIQGWQIGCILQRPVTEFMCLIGKDIGCERLTEILSSGISLYAKHAP